MSVIQPTPVRVHIFNDMIINISGSIVSIFPLCLFKLKEKWMNKQQKKNPFENP